MRASGEGTIQAYLRDGPSYSSWVHERVIPLGEHAGVPDVAATVDLASVLDRCRPDMAKQVRQPTAVLLPVRERPV